MCLFIVTAAGKEAFRAIMTFRFHGFPGLVFCYWSSFARAFVCLILIIIIRRQTKFLFRFCRRTVSHAPVCSVIFHVVYINVP